MIEIIEIEPAYDETGKLIKTHEQIERIANEFYKRASELQGKLQPFTVNVHLSTIVLVYCHIIANHPDEAKWKIELFNILNDALGPGGAEQFAEIMLKKVAEFKLNENHN